MSAFSTSTYSRRRKQQRAKVKNTRRITTSGQIINAVESAEFLNVNNLTVTGTFGQGNSTAGSITLQTVRFTLEFSGSGENEIIMRDGLAEGLVIRDESPQDFLIFDTLDDTIEPRVPIQFANASGLNEIIVANTQAEALVIRNEANTVDFLRVDSTAGNLEIPVTIDTNTITAFTGDLDLTSSAGDVNVTASTGIDLTSTTGDITATATAGSVVLDGGEAVSDAIQLTASNAAGGITLSTGSGGVNFPKATVTQITSITTTVSIDSTAGVIETVDIAGGIGAEGSAAFTVENDRVTASSVVLVNVVEYNGTYGTNGLPFVNVEAITGGGTPSFDIRIINAHSSNALDQELFIAFLVI